MYIFDTMYFAAVGVQDIMYIFDNLYFEAVGGQDIMFIFDDVFSSSWWTCIMCIQDHNYVR